MSGKRHVSLALLAGAFLGVLWSAGALRSGPGDRPAGLIVLPRWEGSFQGVAGRTLKDSTQAWPPPVKAPKGAPNVLVVLIDDAGYGNPSAFGGPIATPTFDKLAATGLRYNRFHNTALCSPSRAALLSGRNHHSVGFGTISELSAGYPGYNCRLPRSAAFVSEVLRQNGYGTAAFGKWHLTPDDETSSAGPFDRWPNALGFDYFYGFHGGESSQYDPPLVENNTVLGPPRVRQKGYHLTADLADRAIQWLRQQRGLAPDKPFFAYFAPGATHAPHHAPKEWIDKYKGQFDGGWDKYREDTFGRQKKLGVIPAAAKLTPRPKAIPAWDSLPPGQKKLYARMMEVYAGFAAHTDHQVGRVVQAIEDLGLREDTLVLYIFGDNGASAEGGLTGSFNELLTLNGLPPLTAAQQSKAIEAYGGLGALGGPAMDNHYPAGWAWAGNTPFQGVKQVASHFGGSRTAMVLSWPKRVKDKGGLRTQFHHFIDVAPTLLEVAGVDAPDVVHGTPQKPIEGVSMAYTFDGPKAKGRRATQYFEMLGYRAVYHDGWMACAHTGRVPWQLSDTFFWRPDRDRWELYHVDEDFSQADDVAAEHPEKLRELQDLFWVEAAKYNVLPIGASFSRYVQPPPPSARTRYTYYPGTVCVPEGTAPDMKGRSHVLTADLDVPKGAEGVIVAQGGLMGGLTLFVQGGKLVYDYNRLGLEHFTLSSDAGLPTGKVTVRYEFTSDGGGRGKGGTGKLFVNGKKVGEGRIKNTVPFRFSSYETLDVGMDLGTPVSSAYRKEAPFPFTGKIGKVTVELRKP